MFRPCSVRKTFCAIAVLTTCGALATSVLPVRAGGVLQPVANGCCTNTVCIPQGMYIPQFGWTGGYKCYPVNQPARCYCPTYVFGIYPGFYYGTNYDAPPASAPPAPAAASAPAATPADPPPALLPPPKVMAEANRARIDVTLPADAELWFQGTKTRLTGAVRHFVTVPLDPNLSYTYDIKATWKENDRPATATRQIVVRAGDRQSITLLASTVSSSPAVANSGR